MQYNASMIINVWITVEWYRMISNHIVVIFNCTNSIKISRKKKRRPDRRFSPDYGWSLGVPPTPSLPGGTPSRSVKTHIFLRRNHIHWWTWYYGIAPPADSDRTLSLSLICWRFGPHNKIPIDLLKTEVNRGQVRRAIDQPPKKNSCIHLATAVGVHFLPVTWENVVPISSHLRSCGCREVGHTFKKLGIHNQTG